MCVSDHLEPSGDGVLHLADPEMRCSIVRVAKECDNFMDLLDDLEEARL